MSGRVKQIIYAWPDGAEAEVTVPTYSPDSVVEICLRPVDPEEPTLVVDPEDQIVTPFLVDEPNRPFSGTRAAKLRGLLLDMGARRLNAGDPTSFVYTRYHFQPILPYARFVPEDRWSGRYEEMTELAPNTPGDTSTPLGLFLGLVDGFTLAMNRGNRPRWSLRLGRFEFDAPTLAEVVDKLCEHDLILPEFQREAWEAEHVERGTWVCPTAEEVELFRMLGEPLPFFWGAERCVAWLRERS